MGWLVGWLADFLKEGVLLAKASLKFMVILLPQALGHGITVI